MPDSSLTPPDGFSDSRGDPVSVGRIFLARVESSSVGFDPSTHAREDLTVFSASYSQVRGQTGSFRVECLYPDGGLLAGPRWCILSAELDGTVTLIARGRIVDFPIALGGDTISFEVACRRDDVSQRVDDLFRFIDRTVPKNVEPSSDPRRVEPYTLSDVYHDPRTLTPRLVPIAGTAAPAATLYGAGSEYGGMSILSMSISINDSPVDRVTIEETTDFRQEIWRDVDIGSAFSWLSPDELRTYTPNVFEGAISGIQLDGGYELMGSGVDYTPGSMLKVYTAPYKVDPFTCIVTPPKFVEYRLHDIDDVKMDVFISATQDRREFVLIPIDVRIADIGGTIRTTESSALSDADGLARESQSMTYTTRRPSSGSGLSQIGGGWSIRTTTRRIVQESVWEDDGRLRETCRASLEALVRRGARVAIERAHCVDIKLSTSDAAAIGLTLKDRVRIYDTRLPGGVAVGKITGYGLELGTSAITSLVVSCPVSDPSSLSTESGSGPYGLAQLIISNVFSAIDPVPNTYQILAVKNRSVSNLVQSVEIKDGAVDQEAVFDGTGPSQVHDIQFDNPESLMLQTGMAMTLLDLTPATIEDLGIRNIRFSSSILRLPEGITL